MYRIYLDGELFYDPRLPEYALTGIKCDLEVNKTGTLRFTIPATHPLIGSVQKMYSELTLYQDKDWLYPGRVLSDDTDFDGNRTIECEGELSYLLDSIQRYHEYHDISVKDYFTDLIAKHNADVDDRKRFVVGTVTVVDPNDSLYRYSTYESTWSTIEDRLIKRLGGYEKLYRIKFEADSLAKLAYEGAARLYGVKEELGSETDDVLQPSKLQPSEGTHQFSYFLLQPSPHVDPHSLAACLRVHDDNVSQI